MNRILNINLGGYAITIDDDAFQYLEAYLTSIRRRFSESEGRDEILHDIESRLGEIITENLRSRSIVMLPDVEAAVQVMGKPEDFGAEPIDNRRNMGSKSAPFTTSIKTGKRIFRDEDDAAVGGVCSGLAAYFGIADPVWMRLIFVLLTFVSAGFWIPAYILMWILIPAAQSSADRLAMRGEPINVDNIAREIEEGFNKFGDKVSEIGADVKKKSGGGGRSFGNALAVGISILGKLFRLFILFISKFGILIAAIVGIALLIALIVSWVAGIWSLFYSGPYLGYFSPISNGMTYLGFANLFFVMGIPFLGILVFFAKNMFRVQTPRWLGASFLGFWLLNFGSLVFVGAKAGSSYRQSKTISSTIDLSGIGSDTLVVDRLGTVNENNMGEQWGPWENDGLRLGNDKLSISGNVDVRVRKSPNGKFQMVKNVTSRGHDIEEAGNNAAQIEFQPVLQKNTLLMPTYYSIPRGQTWKMPKIRVYLEVPVGKSVVFDEKIYHFAAADMDEYAPDNDRNYISKTPGKVFKMTSAGLICTECSKWGDPGYRDNEVGFNEYILEGNFDTEITKGDEFEIEITGANKKDIQSIRSDSKLTLTTNGTTLPAGAKVRIKTPSIRNLIAYETGNVTIRGFEEGEMSFTARGNTQIKAFMDADDLKISLNGKCTMDLTGDGRNLRALLTDGAELRAGAFSINDATINASTSSNARLNADDGSVQVKADKSSSVKVDGNASVNVIGEEKEEGN